MKLAVTGSGPDAASVMQRSCLVAHGVELAEDLTGPYDVVPSVQASSLDELGRRIVFRIQVLDASPTP
jgi:hypothetical protein